MLDGVLVRRVGYGGRFGAELLADGDLLRPWEFDGEDTIGFETGWRVLTPDAPGRARPAVDRADGAATRASGPALAGRALARSRRLTAMMAIAQQPRLDDRLWMLFWELADRHGRVHADGVHVDLPLTHEVLSHLVARPPPVGLGRADEAGRRGGVRRNGRGWVLHGEPP